jgi:hypothetical protein
VGEYVAAFFLKTLFLTKRGFLFSSGAACSQARFAAFSFAQSGIALESFENPVSNETVFFYALCGQGKNFRFLGL